MVKETDDNEKRGTSVRLMGAHTASQMALQLLTYTTWFNALFAKVRSIPTYLFSFSIHYKLQRLNI